MVCGLLEGIDVLRAHRVDTDGRTFLIGGGSQSPGYRRWVADAGGTIVAHNDPALLGTSLAGLLGVQWRPRASVLAIVTDDGLSTEAAADLEQWGPRVERA